jgi:hypothetical protein
MADKAAKKKAPKKASKKTSSRRTIPTALIVRMVEEGEDALTIAKRVNRVNDGPDKTHSVRAIISRLRTHGYKDEHGRTHRLRVELIGNVSKTKKAKKKTGARKTTGAKKTIPKSIATATTQLDGKMLAAGSQ